MSRLSPRAKPRIIRTKCGWRQEMGWSVTSGWWTAWGESIPQAWEAWRRLTARLYD